jgi:serine/threonine protein phosphatase PrpC
VVALLDAVPGGVWVAVGLVGVLATIAVVFLSPKADGDDQSTDWDATFDPRPSNAPATDEPHSRRTLPNGVERRSSSASAAGRNTSPEQLEPSDPPEPTEAAAVTTDAGWREAVGALRIDPLLTDETATTPATPGNPTGVMPLTGGGNGAVWVHRHPQQRLLRLGLWMERRNDKGEDALPTLAHGADLRIGLLGVFDGAGGAGAGLVNVGEDGASHTGAWVASRVVRNATEGWFHDELSERRGIETFTTNVHTALHGRLTDEMHQVAGSSRLAGTLRRDLPTTMATLAYQLNPDDTVTMAAMWAGDSRVFLLTPSSGLQQLTVDDSGAEDALAALVDDPPMTNVVSADGNFEVHLTPRETDTPAVLLCATDGCFGYVATPAHFELLLLRSLVETSDVEEWFTVLLERIATTTNDDASLAAIAVGFPDDLSLRRAFERRLAELERDHWEPFQEIDTSDHAQLVAFRQSSWERYRTGYEALLQTDGDSR